jgi:predicted acetylornithine/succinylornithine family transaminase
MTDRFSRFLAPTYAPAPVTPVRGDGCRVWDADGNEYLDAVAGVAVASLGHAHPELTAAIADQAGRIMAISNHYLIAESIAAAEALIATAFPGKVFFCNSGAEANEAAIKFARRYHYGRGDRGRTGIVTFEGAFHGRTLGALAATGQPRFCEGFGPMPGGFRQLPWNDPAALASVDETVAAILVETIQGEAGVRIASPEFFKAVRAAADAAGCLVIVDEIQTGVGRTGAWHGYLHAGPRPDIATFAKGLGGGVPVGATLASDAVAAALFPGAHGSTFGGNPLATRAVGCVLGVIRRDGLVANAAAMGSRLVAALREGLSGHAALREVRGQGLMVAAELTAPAKPAGDRARELGLLVNVTAGNVLRFLPPLTVSPEEIDAMAAIAVRAVKETL